jgi:hypothetical protein
MKNILVTICAVLIGLCAHAQNFNQEINLNASFSKSSAIHPFSNKTIVINVDEKKVIKKIIIL